MQNVVSWQPSKFQPHGATWVPSRHPSEVAISSRFAAGQMLAAYLKAIAVHASGDLLDLGCGRVPLYGAYREKVRSVTCVDWQHSEHETTHLDLTADLNHPILLPSDSFDTIISSDVLEHIWNHQTLWSETARLLKPGGRLLLGTPFLYRLHEEPHDYFRWTRHALARACADNGLEVNELQATGGALDVLADITIKLAHTKSVAVAKGMSRVAGTFLSRGPLRRLSDRSSSTMPFGYLLVARKAPR